MSLGSSNDFTGSLKKDFFDSLRKHWEEFLSHKNFEIDLKMKTHKFFFWISPYQHIPTIRSKERKSTIPSHGYHLTNSHSNNSSFIVCVSVLCILHIYGCIIHTTRRQNGSCWSPSISLVSINLFEQTTLERERNIDRKTHSHGLVRKFFHLLFGSTKMTYILYVMRKFQFAIVVFLNSGRIDRNGNVSFFVIFFWQ